MTDQEVSDKEIIARCKATRKKLADERSWQMNEEEKALRAKIAYDIRAELVCCDIYDKTAPQRAEINKQKAGWTQALTELEDAVGAHEICYWGEVSAQIAERGIK